jgi:hypothetical protein
MSRSWLVAALAALCTLAGPARPARSTVDRNIYRSSNKQLDVEVVFPVDWAVSEQASYPGVVLATAVDRSLGGKMTLAVDHLREGEKLGDCVERNRVALGKLGFKIQGQNIVEPKSQPSTGAVWMQVATPDGRQLVRQAYRQLDPETDVVYVITLAAPRETLQRYLRAFDDTVRGMARARKAPAKKPEPTPPPEQGGETDVAPTPGGEDQP